MNKKIFGFLLGISLFFCFFTVSFVSADTNQYNNVRAVLIRILQDLLANNSAYLASPVQNYYNNGYNNYNNNYNCTGNCPYVFAGSNKTIQPGQSVYLDATVSNQNNSYPLTYLWTCTGGSLSNYNILNPTYYAPNISYSATYLCTLTVSNYQGSNSSGVSISVAGSGYNNYYCSGYNCNNAGYPSVSAGSKKSVQSGQSVYLDATVSNQNNSYPLTYLWICTGGSLSNYNILNPTYYAPNISYDTNYICTLTASNYQGSSSSGITISVIGNGYNNNYYYNYNNNGYYNNNNNGYNDCAAYGYGCSY
jgi:hypothetical protein